MAVPKAASDPATSAPAGSPENAQQTWLTRLGTVLGLVLLSLAILTVTVLIVVPKATGSQSYSVLTNSMAPKYAPGTFLVVQPAPFEELKPGDVVTFQLKSGEPAVVTHRIVGFGFLQNGEKTLVTKGDNNDAEDPSPVREVQVKGKLLYAVPYVGYVANALGNSSRSDWVVPGAGLLIAYGAFTIVGGVRDSRRNKTAAKDREAL